MNPMTREGWEKMEWKPDASQNDKKRNSHKKVEEGGKGGEGGL